MLQQAEYVEVSFFKSGSRDKGVSRKQTGGSKQLIKKHLQAGASLIPRPFTSRAGRRHSHMPAGAPNIEAG
jgi:hypothetical protein